MSRRMLQRMVNGNDKIDLSEEEINKIQNMITGQIPSGEENRSFLYEIVANKNNGIDVDKFDYLARDSRNLGIETSSDSDRLMKYSAIIDGHICFSAKIAFQLYQLLHTRYTLFKCCYTHRVVQQIDNMLLDIFMAADNAMGWSDCVEDDDCSGYMKLTDKILLDLERDESYETEKARNIIHRLRTRQLYRFVDEHMTDGDKIIGVTPEAILKVHERSGDKNVAIRLSDIIVAPLTLNYNMKDSDPVTSKTWFYNNPKGKKFQMARSQISFLVSQTLQEHVIRIYSRTRDNDVVAAIAKAFGELINELTNSTVKKEPVPTSHVNRSVDICVRNRRKQTQYRPEGVKTDTSMFPQSPAPEKDSFGSNALKRSHTVLGQPFLFTHANTSPSLLNKKRKRKSSFDTSLSKSMTTPLNPPLKPVRNDKPLTTTNLHGILSKTGSSTNNRSNNRVTICAVTPIPTVEEVDENEEDLIENETEIETEDDTELDGDLMEVDEGEDNDDDENEELAERRVRDFDKVSQGESPLKKPKFGFGLRRTGTWMV
eukprot:TRINITY_DN131921_c0_g1_i2.p1 TRINITY_DN131921_c0_g1~~TRINITY_DN131921_c0_g1_i2.p1  ORF type:complete len:622 (+),score=158.91 TRINITY_DN131921_c0_g1_i2:243-1868(+)